MTRHCLALAITQPAIGGSQRCPADPYGTGATCCWGSTQDAVTLTDAAQRLGRRTAESLRLLAEGKRGPGGFPAPIVDTGKLRVYSFAEITAWLPHGLDRGLNQSHQRATEASWTELRFTKRPGRNLVGGMQGTRNEQVVGSIPIGGYEAVHPAALE
jgi:hypothetical protein